MASKVVSAGLVFESIQQGGKVVAAKHLKGLFKNFVCMISLSSIAGCATFERPDYTVSRVMLPNEKGAVTRELGDTLLLQGLEQTSPSVRFITPLKTDIMMFNSVIEAPPQTLRPVFKTNKNSDAVILVLTQCHVATGLFAAGSSSTPKEHCPPSKDVSDITILSDITIPAFFYRPNHDCPLFLQGGECVSNNVVWEEAIYRDFVPDTYKKELVYNGRLENYIKVIYREYLNNWARPAFTQELQYDLNESKVIGFQGARLEILDATNTKIEYRVLSHFPEPE